MPIQTLSDVLAERGAQQDQSNISQIQQATGLAGLMDSLRKRKEDEDLRNKISQLTPEQQNDPNVIRGIFLQNAAPKDALAYLGRDPSQGQPEIVKLQRIEQQLRAMGDTGRADQIAAHISKSNQTESSAGQENLNYLSTLATKVRSGQQLTPEEDAKGRAIYSQTTTKISPFGAATIDIGAGLDPNRGFGVQAPVKDVSPPGNQTPVTNIAQELASAGPDEKQALLNVMNADKSGTPATFSAGNPNVNLSAPQIQQQVSPKVSFQSAKPEKTLDEKIAETTALSAAKAKGAADIANENSLSGGALDAAVAKYKIDGTFPPNLGRGVQGQVNTSRILTEYARQVAESGDTQEQGRIKQLANKANSAALIDLSKRESQVGAFEKTFIKNTQLVESLSAKVDRTGVPIINKWLNAGKRSVTGDEDIVALDLAIKGAVNEYTKIVSGSLGNTAIAIGEIKKIDSLLNAAQTPEQIIRVIQTMRLETGNRISGFKEQKDEIFNNYKQTNSTQVAPQQNTQAQSPGQSAGALLPTQVRLPDGTIGNFKSGAAAQSYKKKYGL